MQQQKQQQQGQHVWRQTLGKALSDRAKIGKDSYHMLAKQYASMDQRQSDAVRQKLLRFALIPSTVDIVREIYVHM